MTLAQTLIQAARIFSLNNIDDWYLEARILLGHILKLSPVELYTQSEQILNQEQIDGFYKLIKRRLNREPTAYITKHKEFYGNGFYVDNRVLIPRPETELLVEQAIEFMKNRTDCFSCPGHHMVVADIGTGCGAIAISLALKLPHLKIYATDISPSALEVARHNSMHHRTTEQITFLQGNLLEPIPEPVDLVAANLPYIKSSELVTLAPEIINFEPIIALDGGRNGLIRVRQILKQAGRKLHRRGRILLEIGIEQEQPVAAMVHRYFKQANFEFIPDLNGINRLVKIDP